MSDDTPIDGTARAIRGPEAAEPAARTIPRRTWVVGAVAAPRARGAGGLGRAPGRAVQPPPVADGLVLEQLVISAPAEDEDR